MESGEGRETQELVIQRAKPLGVDRVSEWVEVENGRMVLRLNWHNKYWVYQHFYSPNAKGVTKWVTSAKPPSET